MDHSAKGIGANSRIISALKCSFERLEKFKNRNTFCNFRAVSILTGLQEYVSIVMYWLFAMH